MRRVFLLLMLLMCSCAVRPESRPVGRTTLETMPLNWFKTDGLAPRAIAFSHLLHVLGEHGLDPNSYGYTQLRAVRESDPSKRNELETLLTRAFVELAVDVRFGRLAARTADGDPSAMTPPRGPAAAALKTRALNVLADPTQSIETFIDSLFPQHAQYHKMKQALATYRAIAQSGGWPTIPPGPALSPGASDSRVPILVDRLRATDDLQSSGPFTSRYSDEIVDCVRAFQRRHGLEPDGVVGKETVDAMNVSVDERIHELMVNLERWRWLDRELGERFVMVNVAGFELVFVQRNEDKSTVLFRTPVIVGQPFLSTPVFSGRIQYVELNPYWNVPKSIEVNEIEPKLRKNPNYLVTQHMELVDDNGWQHLRQTPGPWNALGAIKFVFPNPYDVYLHDTPSKALFRERKRTFSHGCIRVKDPLELAELLLGGESAGWSAHRLKDIVGEGRNVKVALSEKIPIHIVYRTAWVDVDGSINFRSDVYGRDGRMIEKLFNQKQVAPGVNERAAQ
ncbi:MAG: L,D-transpeptidase family protein [Bdellovibrionota bacterium]